MRKSVLFIRCVDCGNLRELILVLIEFLGVLYFTIYLKISTIFYIRWLKDRFWDAFDTHNVIFSSLEN